MKWVQTKRKEFTYLDKILYDEFEQRSYIRYGNGAETSYTYKPDNRLLNNLKVNSGGIQMMNNTYSYDSLQNITQVLNNGSTANTIGGGISYNYHYDKLNRLDSASGEFTGYNGKKAKYTLSMSYDNMHNITRKKQDMVQSGLKFGGILHAGYELNYTINVDNCQQIRNIAESSYRQASPATAAYQTGIQNGVELKHKTEEYGYDANGNLLSVLTGTRQGDNLQVTNSRKMLWDEENRLQAVSDNGFVSNYYYDASGERTVKLSGASQGVYVNGALNNATTQTNRFTAYISPYLVLNSGGYYSKHIYAGTQRIVSKLGSSEIFHSAPTFSSLPTGKLTGLTATVKARYDSLGVAYHGSPQGTNGFETSALGKINTPQLYFYHPDHLGSSSLITDNNGLLVQHLQYLPFGEVFIDERKGSWHTPFTFSAKEQDEETGLHYFSARYYDSRTSTWLNVDPLAEDYPNLSSYVYCHNNPVKYVDPDGRDWFVNGSNGNVVFLRGVNTITNTQRVKYGLGNYRYENLGKDNMFGKNLSEINGQNVLMFNGPYFSEKFMNKHGLVKAEVLSVSETKIENTDYGHIGIYNPEPITTTTVLQLEIYDSRLTFVSPNKLNTKSNVKRDIGESSFNSIETTSYDLIKPVNQNVNTTSVYSNDRVSIKWDNVSNGIQTLFDIAPYLLNLFKR